MDEIDPLGPIRSVRGVGPGTIASLMDKLGGEKGLIRALEDRDVGAISSADRVSGRIAVNLILSYHREAQSDLLANDGAREVHDDIVRRLQERMHTQEARDRCMLLVPGKDLVESARRASERFDHSTLVTDRDRIDALLSAFSKGSDKRGPPRRSSYAIVTEDEHAYSKVREKGLDRYCRIIDASELEGGIEEELIYVYNGRELDESMVPAVSIVSCEAPAHAILPDVVLERFMTNRDRISIVSELQRIYGLNGRCGRAGEILDDLIRTEVADKGSDSVNEELSRIRDSVEASLKKALEGVVLRGTDTIDVLSGEDPPALMGIYREHSRMAQSLVKERLGVNRDLFVMRYPLAFDEPAVEDTIAQMGASRREKRFRRRLDLAAELFSMEEEIGRELSWARELDFRFGIGTFVLDLDLKCFEVSDGWFGMRSASHLSIRGKEGCQDVDYHLGRVPSGCAGQFDARSSDRIALLTGANSGGKSTLLETIAQVVVMSHMGLPVPAAGSNIPQFDTLHVYRPKRHMDAGGLEGFLREFLPLCLDAGPRSLVLADELEAMTELEASVKIIRSFLRELETRCAFSVVVTHLAAEVAGGHPFRIDGIEAKGLDDGFNLIVDRTPKICHQARSMPELILKRLLGRSKGPEKELYGRVLSEFTPPSS